MAALPLFHCRFPTPLAAPATPGADVSTPQQLPPPQAAAYKLVQPYIKIPEVKRQSASQLASHLPGNVQNRQVNGPQPIKFHR